MTAISLLFFDMILFESALATSIRYIVIILELKDCLILKISTAGFRRCGDSTSEKSLSLSLHTMRNGE